MKTKYVWRLLARARSLVLVLTVLSQPVGPSTFCDFGFRWVFIKIHRVVWFMRKKLKKQEIVSEVSQRWWVARPCTAGRNSNTEKDFRVPSIRFGWFTVQVVQDRSVTQKPPNYPQHAPSAKSARRSVTVSWTPETSTAETLMVKRAPVRSLSSVTSLNSQDMAQGIRPAWVIDVSHPITLYVLPAESNQIS